MKTKLPPGPIRPSGNYYLLNCVPFKKKIISRIFSTNTCQENMISVIHTRPGDFIPADIIFISLRRLGCRDCQLQRAFAEHQCLCNDPAVSNSWWWRSDSRLSPSPADGGDSDVAQAGDRSELAAVSCCGCFGGEVAKVAGGGMIFCLARGRWPFIHF